jgi:ketosteroid isomerase-like protein
VVFLEHYDPESLLWVSPGHSLESGCFVGASAVEWCFTEFIAAFGGSFRVEAEEFIDVGDSVIVLTTERAQARRSGADVSSRQHPLIYTLRAGKIIRIDVYPRRTDALEAAGLQE